MPAFNKHFVSGRIGRKPELRYTPSGKAATSFSLARQIRRLNPSTNQWEDGELTWYEVSAFDRLAENIAASMDTGYDVTVIGELKLNSYTTKSGEARTDLKLNADDVLLSLDHQQIQMINKSAYGDKSGTGNQGQNRQNNNSGNGSASVYPSPSAAAPANDEDAPF
jgi:single-strand DNA-binding protein